MDFNTAHKKILQMIYKIENSNAAIVRIMKLYARYSGESDATVSNGLLGIEKDSLEKQKSNRKSY